MSRVVVNFTLSEDQYEQFKSLVGEQKNSHFVKDLVIDRLERKVLDPDDPCNSILSLIESWKVKLGPIFSRKYHHYLTGIRQYTANLDSMLQKDKEFNKPKQVDHETEEKVEEVEAEKESKAAPA